jgi:hypothetical protein
VQRRVQRALLNAEHITRHLLYTLGDSPSVLRPQGKRSQDQKIQCPLWKINSFFAQIITPLTSTKRQIHYSFVEVQGEIKEGSQEARCWPSGCITGNPSVTNPLLTDGRLTDGRPSDQNPVKWQNGSMSALP